MRFVREGDDRTLQDQVELALIPAPPFGEAARAALMERLLAEAGLDSLWRDSAGNVLALLTGGADPEAPPLILAAHLDSAFPPGTPVTLRRDGPRIRVPGITDDARGLAALVALARALRGARVPLGAPILFVATVGEEGSGDLRGAKHLFRPGGEGREAAGFISLDGAGIDGIVVRGVGSRRLRLTIGGPGGHSWSDFGTPNPIHLLGEVVARLNRLPLPGLPRTTCTVARWGGGTGINAIPGEAWIEMDLRSEDPQVLARLEESVLSTAREAVATGQLLSGLASGGSSPEIRLAVEVIGDRPGGATDPDTPLVRAALAATRALGGSPSLLSASTDANVPMSLGIPALTMGAGGQAGGAHTLDEWYENEGGPEGILRALYTVLLTVGVMRPAGTPGD